MTMSLLRRRGKSKASSEASIRTTASSPLSESPFEHLTDQTHSSESMGPSSVNSPAKLRKRLSKIISIRSRKSKQSLRKGRFNKGSPRFPFRLRFSDDSSLKNENASFESSNGNESFKDPQPHADLDCDSSCSSMNSLLSSYSADESINECFRGMARIEKRFEMRDNTFQRIVKGKRKSYTAMLRSQEDASREMTIKAYNNRDGTKEACLIGKDLAKASPVERIWWIFLFESHHTTEGILAVVLNCVGFSSFYAVLERLLNWIMDQTSLSENMFHFMVICVGAAMMRANGYLWFWLNVESYNLVKFEMHNRANLHYLDARLLARMKGTLLSSLFNLFSFYGTYIGVAFFYYKWMDIYLYDPLEDWYDEVIDEVDSVLSEEPDETCDAIDFYCSLDACYGGAEAATFMSEQSTVTCEAIEKLVTSVYRRRFAYYLCNCDDDWTEVAFAYHMLMLLSAAIAMHIVLGMNFLKACD
jgi:hypothetical protein